MAEIVFVYNDGEVSVIAHDRLARYIDYCLQRGEKWNTVYYNDNGFLKPAEYQSCVSKFDEDDWATCTFVFLNERGYKIARGSYLVDGRA